MKVKHEWGVKIEAYPKGESTYCVAVTNGRQLEFEQFKVKEEEAARDGIGASFDALRLPPLEWHHRNLVL